MNLFMNSALPATSGNRPPARPIKARILFGEQQSMQAPGQTLQAHGHKIQDKVTLGRSKSPDQTAQVDQAKANPFNNVDAASPLGKVQPNELKRMFWNNEAVMYAVNIRTFGAHDDNHDGVITPGHGESGTFRSAIPKLDQLSALGVNTIHLLPINPVGLISRLGRAGSLYATADYHRINPEFGTLEDAKAFVDAAHQRGIKVMVDVPSCASQDLMRQHPDLILRDKHGKPAVPTDWVDIAMFKNGKPLQDYYEPFFDMMANKVGVDGFRTDVARARTTDFWKHFIGKYPDKAWLAESYTQEDESPLKNIPRDTPETFLKSGFDAIYGQLHIFPSMANAKEYMNYMLSCHAMFQRAGEMNGQGPKSMIGSFLTHDDPSLMGKGGVLVSLLTSGLMTTQPYTNPYIIDGFLTGFKGDYDLFRFSKQPVGEHPEIGRFMKDMLAVRKEYGPVLTQGKFIPIPVRGGADNQIISYARQAGDKTLLIVANKDLNANEGGSLTIPGMTADQPLKNLAPSYGGSSWLRAGKDRMDVLLAPGRFYMFEINTPDLAKKLPSYSGQ